MKNESSTLAQLVHGTVTAAEHWRAPRSVFAESSSAPDVTWLGLHFGAVGREVWIAPHPDGCRLQFSTERPPFLLEANPSKR